MQSSDLGCHLGDEYRGCIAYADDIISLSTSLINLQKGLIRVLMVHRLHGQRVLNTLVWILFLKKRLGVDISLRP